jgi:hypothetical protein
VRLIFSHGLNPLPLLLVSGLPVVIAVPLILISLLIIVRIFRQSAAARRVGVTPTVSDAILGGLQEQVQSTLLVQEQIYERLRENGEAATAQVLTLMDTNIRIGDHASMLRLSVEVFPKNRPSFRANTRQAISDATRLKFMPGSTVYVRFDPNDAKQVALDGAPAEAPPGASALDCPSCGAAQHVTGGLATCVYCSRPLARG